MPKGVEQGVELVDGDGTVTVQQPLMPKGVEQTESADCVQGEDMVQQPLMPKGVEQRRLWVDGDPSGAKCNNL